MRIYDITVSISTELPVYPGDPGVQIQRTLSLEAGDVARVSRLSFGTHIGTHVDPPSHFVMDGASLDELPLDVLIGPARVVDVGEAPVIDTAVLDRADLDGAARVLFKTRNSRLWQETTEFAKDFVYLEADAAERLVKRGVRLVGIDYLSIEKFNFEEPTTHLTLLSNHVIIIEGLNLSEVAAGDYELICLPLKIRNGDGGPARVVLRDLQ